MKQLNYYCLALFISLFTLNTHAQISTDITFTHEGKVVYGTFTKPANTGKYTTLIIGPGSGGNDRNGTLPMQGPNIACLYPNLLNDTIKSYKGLAEGLTAAGFAVLRYDKLEYTYTTDLGEATFEKLWMPINSAINYLKTRNDVDTQKIVLIGHSESSTLIPFIAKTRTDIAALISIGGARTPFDSILAKQLVFFADECNGNVPQARLQGNQILAYFDLVRKEQYSSSTPPLFGVKPEEWKKYTDATDPVHINYNTASLPTLFVGMEKDFNVPPAELDRFKNDVTITSDFWSIAELNHYMTDFNTTAVSKTLIDTVVYWLTQKKLANINQFAPLSFKIFPNPSQESITIVLPEGINNAEVELLNNNGLVIKNSTILQSDTVQILLNDIPKGLYLVRIKTKNQMNTSKIIKN